MNSLLRPRSAFAQVYIDKIVIHSISVEEQAERLRSVLQLVRHEKLYAKRKKCTFRAQQIEFLGFIVKADGIHSQPEKLEVVAMWLRTVKVYCVWAYGFH